MLEMEHVTFQYTPDTPTVLEDINLSFEKGEFVAVTGRNGCGKTTVTRLLTGLEKPTRGSIVYNGSDVTREDAAKRSRFIGYVFQQPDRQMFMPTVRQEIGFGPAQQGRSQAEIDELVYEAMEAVGISKLADEYPRTLSRGDQQRVAIASALAMNTEYLILDEPTSGQDGSEKKRIVSLLQELVKTGICLILITHDMDIVAHACERTVVIGDKKVIYDGRTEDLFTPDAKFEKWGLAFPPAVMLGYCLPGAPYCKDMKTFCAKYLEAKAAMEGGEE